MGETNLILTAPVSGWAAPLDEVADPVFSGRMLGDGVAIDPTGATLHAPCAGRIVSIHRAGHAVSLLARCGAEILIHIGLETVALGGEGFQSHVRDGQDVETGDLLISFDLEVLAERAKSLITPMVVTNGDDYVIVRRKQDRRVVVGDFLMEIADARTADAPGGEATAGVSRQVVVPLAHGLHARPAALIAAEAKRHRADIHLATAGRRANARSPVAILTLGLGHQDAATLTASGPDAAAALAAVAALIEHGLPPESAAPSLAKAAPPAPPPQSTPASLRGTPAAPGLAIGAAVRLIAPQVSPADHSGDMETELSALARAVEAVRNRLTGQALTGPAEQREIVRAHLAFLADDDLTAEADASIRAGAAAGAAWRDAIGVQVAVLRQVGDRRIAERADDLLDLERQVLIELSGEAEPRQILPNHAIVLADDLVPSQLIGLTGTLAGVCTAGGGPTSHVAILATAMNIPAVVAIGAGLMGVPDGTTLILDGEAGLLSVAPGAAEIEAAQSRLAMRQARRQQSRTLAAEPCRMVDGTRVEVFANLGSLADAEAALANGAEGCGLLRTEFLFLERSTAPDEDEQARCYQAVAEALEGRPLVIRTLDIGGDKPAPFLDLPVQENPAMGLRGVRVSLWRPELLRAQIRAILRVEPRGQCRILIPMIASLSELGAVRAMIDAAREEIGYGEAVQVGVMVETPAAAITADLIARDADFLSIGTNDLTQYVLAMDRGNPQLAAQVDALHPAVLRLIAAAARGGRELGRPVAVCGGLAADLAAVAILIGLGVTELSAPPGVIPEIKAQVRGLTLEGCEALAARALACGSADEVRALTAGGDARVEATQGAAQ